MRLTISEAHTYVTQGLQKQGAFKKDNQFQQAIDWALNKATHKFIRAALVPIQGTDRFQINETSRQDVQNLIVTNLELIRIKQLDGGRYYSTYLPSNFKYLLSDKSYVREDCKDISNLVETRSRRIIQIAFPESAGTGGQFYQTINIVIGTVNIPLTTAGFTSPKDKVYVIDYIIKQFLNNGIEMYWETFEDVYKPDTFIFATENLTSNYSITIDGVALVLTSTTVSTSNLVKYNTEETILRLHRNLQNDMLDSALTSHYSRSKSTSPVSTIANNYLEVYTDKKFLLGKVLIDYIRQPRPVNLLLNHGFDMHESTHDRISDVAIEIMKEQTENNSLKTSVEFNTLKNKE